MFLAFTTALSLFIFFFFNDTATTEIYTLSLHDALPISVGQEAGELPRAAPAIPRQVAARGHIRQEVHERAGIDRTMCRIRRGALREVVLEAGHSSRSHVCPIRSRPKLWCGSSCTS